MASIQKTAKGYRAQIKMSLPGHDKPVRDSQVFPTRREAQEWAARRETEIRNENSLPAGELHSLRDAMRRYAEEVSPTKRGWRWEHIRLAAFEGYFPASALDQPIARVSPQTIADFRDKRSRTIGPGSVLRELTLLSGLFEVARLEWKWVQSNPCRDIRKPSAPNHRERIIHWQEVRAMLRQMGHRPRGGPIVSISQATALCFLMALRTGMRAGELCGLEWSQVRDDYVILPMTKNGKARRVPMSSRALRILARMKGWDDVLVFGVHANTLSTLFRKYRGRAGLSGFTFHDSRHTAATMLARKVDVLTLCKIFGWSNPKQAMVYYNPSASAIAGMLG